MPDLWVNNFITDDGNLYQNQGDGTFANVTDEVLLLEELGGDDHGAAWADFDNDGDLDLVQLDGAEGATDTSPGKIPFWYNDLYVNEDGQLRDQAIALGIDDPLRRSQSPIWFDYDNDGNLDLFVGAFPRENNEFPPTIYRQTADGFEEALSTTGFDLAFAPYGFLSDLSGDGKLDLIIKSRNPAPPLVVYDTTTLPFTDLSSTLLPKVNIQDLAAADFNGDLLPDLFVTQNRDFLLENTGEKLVKRTEEVGLGNTTTNGVSVAAADF